jgi:hypothetical protein
MATDNAAAIAALEIILNAGAKAVNTDGLSVTFDLVEVRKRRDQLLREQGDTTRVKRKHATLNLGNCW